MIQIPPELTPVGFLLAVARVVFSLWWLWLPATLLAAAMDFFRRPRR